MSTLPWRLPARSGQKPFRNLPHFADGLGILYKKGVPSAHRREAQGRHGQHPENRMSIVAARSVTCFFSEAVLDAIRVRRVGATDGATRYLVGLLVDYTHPDGRAGETLDRPLTLLLDEALRAHDAGERFERLKTLGDGVLYGCGFFGDHFEARGVDSRYLEGLGVRAYCAARSMLRGADDGQDLFGELAENFGAFVAVVADVADASLAMGTDTSRGLLKAYEKWLKTGSDRLAAALTSKGVVPTRSAKGYLH
jgi:hypothetical protein